MFDFLPEPQCRRISIQDELGISYVWDPVWNCKRPWEDSDEWVGAELLVLAAPARCRQTEVGEGASQENIRDLDLRDKAMMVRQTLVAQFLRLFYDD